MMNIPSAPPAYAPVMTPDVVARIALDKLEGSPQWHFVSLAFAGLMAVVTVNNILFMQGIPDEQRRFLGVLVVLQCFAAIVISANTRNAAHADALAKYVSAAADAERGRLEMLRGTSSLSGVVWAVMAGSALYAGWAIWTAPLDWPARWSVLLTNFAAVFAVFVHAKTVRDRAEADALRSELTKGR